MLAEIAIPSQLAGEEPDDAGGGDGAEDTGNRHPEFPEHKPNGEWAPGNSGVEGEVEAQKAFDLREKNTGIPIEREKIWVTLVDPETGKTLRREYDGLEPIPGQPGQYTGLEHKLGKRDPTENQKTVDGLVKSGHPAHGTLRGEPVEIVDTELIRTPRPDAPPIPSAEAPTGTADEFRGAQGEGSVDLRAPPILDDWGTQISPEELIQSDDPALRIIGQELIRQRAPNDPRNWA